MPLYQYRCPYCGYEQEEYRYNFKNRDKSTCDECGGSMIRAHDKEIPNIRPDIEPGFNQSIGAHVGSRRELREHMAFHNAASNDMIVNSYPSDGRLVKEERAEVLSKSNIFDDRNKRGWGRKPSTSGFDIDIDGKADYQEIRDYAKKYKKGVK